MLAFERYRMEPLVTLYLWYAYSRYVCFPYDTSGTRRDDKRPLFRNFNHEPSIGISLRSPNRGLERREIKASRVIARVTALLNLKIRVLLYC